VRILFVLLMRGSRQFIFTYPWRDDQAELTWVTGYIPRWFKHPSK